MFFKKKIDPFFHKEANDEFNKERKYRSVRYKNEFSNLAIGRAFIGACSSLLISGFIAGTNIILPVILASVATAAFAVIIYPIEHKFKSYTASY